MLGFEASATVKSSLATTKRFSLSVAGMAVASQTRTLMGVPSQGRSYWKVRVALPVAVARNVQYSVPPPPGSPGLVAT